MRRKRSRRAHLVRQNPKSQDSSRPRAPRPERAQTRPPRRRRLRPAFYRASKIRKTASPLLAEISYHMHRRNHASNANPSRSRRRNFSALACQGLGSLSIESVTDDTQLLVRVKCITLNGWDMHHIEIPKLDSHNSNETSEIPKEPEVS